MIQPPAEGQPEADGAAEPAAADTDAAASDSADASASGTEPADGVPADSDSAELAPTDSASETESVEPAAETDSPTAEGDTDSPRETASEQAPAAPPIAEAIIRPKPDAAKINKCIKEWQVGSHRVRQLVHWLCDPFGDSDASGVPPAVLSMMPSLSTLQPGDQVVGVIVGVMPFGVFVELAPDCSGLIHVSKVSDGFVEDLHEAVQVGDVVTAWVTGVDEKRRRVALSAISPEREAELQSQRGQREGHGHGGGRPPRGGQPARGGQQRGGQQSGGQQSGGQQRAPPRRTSPAEDKVAVVRVGAEPVAVSREAIAPAVVDPVTVAVDNAGKHAVPSRTAWSARNRRSRLPKI